MSSHLIRATMYLALAAALFWIGCTDGSTPKDLQGRLNAANEITATPTRNTALVEVAIAAGEAGDGPVALGAVQGITDMILRGKTAATVALALAKAGKSQDAVDVKPGS